MESDTQDLDGATIASERGRESLPPPLPARPSGVWGFWATSGFGVLILLIWLVAQVALGVIYFLGRLVTESPDAEGLDGLLEGLEHDGLMIAITFLGSFPVLVACCCGVVYLRRRHGISMRDYFALRPMSAKAWLFWPVATILFGLLVGLILKACGAPEIDPWMEKLAENVTHFWWLAFVIVICAPIGEEFFFRGFLFKGWMESSLGKVGTVILSSFVFAVIHLQYGSWGLISIFLLGLLLGTARVVTGSLWAPILIHFVNNLFAMFLLYDLTFCE